MTKKSLMIGIFLILCNYSYAEHIKINSREYKIIKEHHIDLNTVHLDSINFGFSLYGGFNFFNFIGGLDRRVLETIKYPTNFKVIEKNFIVLQGGQYSYSLAKKSKAEYNRLKEENKNFQDWFEKAKRKYTDQYVDCVIAFCLLKDKNDNYYFIFDENNDENLSNDKILKFTDTIKHVYEHKNYYKAETKITFEYFNGSEVVTKILPIGVFFRKPAEHQLLSIYITKFEFELGKIITGENEYLVGLHSKEVEFNEFQAKVWVDKNQNKNYDPYETEAIRFDTTSHSLIYLENDYHALLVKDVDRFGKSITIIELKYDKTKNTITHVLKGIKNVLNFIPRLLLLIIALAASIGFIYLIWRIVTAPLPAPKCKKCGARMMQQGSYQDGVFQRTFYYCPHCNPGGLL